MIDFFSINEPVTVVASSEDARSYTRAASELGSDVRNTEVWDGPVPAGSFMPTTNPFVRMCTPEYMFLRKANQLDLFDAIKVGCVLLSSFNTDAINPNIEPGRVELVSDGIETHTTAAKLKSYLMPIRDTYEGRRALMVLCAAEEVAHIYEDALLRQYKAQRD